MQKEAWLRAAAERDSWRWGANPSSLPSGPQLPTCLYGGGVGWGGVWINGF